VGAAQEAVEMKFRIDVVRVGDDGTEQSSAMMVLSRGPLALETLGLTLAESKELLHNVQTYLVEQQAAAYLEQHRSCPQCGRHYTSKGQGSSTINTVFGPVAVPNTVLIVLRVSAVRTQNVQAQRELAPGSNQPRTALLGNEMGFVDPLR
jgi:hypothetical protein